MIVDPCPPWLSQSSGCNWRGHRQRQTETDRDRQRQTETDRGRQRQTETDRDSRLARANLTAHLPVVAALPLSASKVFREMRSSSIRATYGSMALKLIVGIACTCMCCGNDIGKHEGAGSRTESHVCQQ